METNKTKIEEPKTDPPGYYENTQCSTDFEQPTTSGHPAQPGYLPQPGYPPPPGNPPPGYTPSHGYPPQPGYTPQSGYTPQPGNPPQPGYMPSHGYPITAGYTPSPYYPSTLPVQQQPLLQQQQQQTVIIQNPQAQYIDNKMTAAILVTLCCFLPTGIVAIIYADKANTFARNGDITSANEANATARRFIIASIAVGCVCIALAIILPFVISAIGFAAAASSSANSL